VSDAELKPDSRRLPGARCRPDSPYPWDNPGYVVTCRGTTTVSERHSCLILSDQRLNPVNRVVSRVLVLSFTDLASDPRVDRQIETLGRTHEVVAAGRNPPRHQVGEFIELPLPQRTLVGNGVALANVLARRYDTVYWTHPAHVLAVERLRDVDADAAIANDLDTLPIALRLGLPVVFDAHEYSPAQESDSVWWRLVVAPYVGWLCRRHIPQVASMMTVSEAIAAAYERDTDVRATVVTNAPPQVDLLPTLVHDPIKILHHGAAQRGRGLDDMVQVANLLDDRFTVDFVLTDVSPRYREALIRQAQGNPRVHFPGPWPMDEIVRKANDYDVGFYSLPPANFNRRFALPNKFFEFIQARLAIVIGPSPEMKRFVERYGLGIVADDFTPGSIAQALNSLDRRAIASFKQRSHTAAADLSAESNAPIISHLVDDVIARGTSLTR
jgi:glycosyltransferase involved in cell wall biosynthesis